MSGREDVTSALRRAAESFERAAEHCRIAAEHLDEGQVPRMGAHAFVAHGDAAGAMTALDQAAQLHASRSLLTGRMIHNSFPMAASAVWPGPVASCAKWGLVRPARSMTLDPTTR